MIKRFATLVAALVGLLPSVPLLGDTANSKSNDVASVVVIPIKHEINTPVLYLIRRGLKTAIDQNVDTVIFDMETPGGRIDTTFEIVKALEKYKGRTITYINSEAISAGAFITAATDEIYFAPGAVIGAAAPVMADGADIGETMKGKMVSYLKARIRAISAGKGYRGEAISAMIDVNSEFKIGERIIKPRGELLSLTSEEAGEKFGDPPQRLLGNGEVASLDALLKQIHQGGNYSVKTLALTWSENLAQYVLKITPLLLGLGLFLLFIEFKTPGFGVFGFAGFSILLIVFLGQFVAGLSGHEPVLVFILGISLILIEVLFFPGMMVLALSGVALLFGSLVWAMADIWPSEPVVISGDLFFRPLASVMAGVGLAVIFFLLLLRFLPKGTLWDKMILTAQVQGEPASVRSVIFDRTAPVESSQLVGESGLAATGLFPSGHVEIHGRRYEARLAIGHADAGTRIRVTGISEFGLSVEVLS